MTISCYTVTNIGIDEKTSSTVCSRRQCAKSNDDSDVHVCNCLPNEKQYTRRGWYVTVDVCHFSDFYDPQADDFQNLISSSLYKDTSLVKFSIFMEIRLAVSREIANRQTKTDRQTEKRRVKCNLPGGCRSYIHTSLALWCVTKCQLTTNSHCNVIKICILLLLLTSYWLFLFLSRL